MQRFGILTKTQVEKVHETSLRILEQATHGGVGAGNIGLFAGNKGGI